MVERVAAPLCSSLISAPTPKNIWKNLRFIRFRIIYGTILPIHHKKRNYAEKFRNPLYWGRSQELFSLFIIRQPSFSGVEPG